jgi:streptogramin lyase
MFNRSVVSVGRWALVVVGLVGLAVLGASLDLFPTVQAQDKKITVYLTKPERGEGAGAILRLDALPQGGQQAQVTEIVTNLTSPENIVCGPDKRLYAEDLVQENGVTISRIVRYNRDGSEPTVMVKGKGPNMNPAAMAFAPNGDLYFSTFGDGLWRLKSADPANQPEQVLSFTTRFYKYRSHGSLAFIPTGPLQGDLLVVDADRTGRVLKAKAPDYTSVVEFIPEAGSFRPAGVAVNSKGEIFVTHFHSSEGRVLKYAPDSTPQGTFSVLNFANQIAIDSTDIVWVTNAVFSGGGVRGGLNRFAPDGNRTLILDRTVIVRGVTVCEE